MKNAAVEVVAALIWQGDTFMICQRPAHKARGLLWEFVGGKVEPGETKEQAPILLSALMFTGCAGTSNNQPNTYRQISMDEAVTMMAEETGYIILDVRRADEFAAGHIPGAINVANESIGTDEIAELPDKNQLIMVYCRSGRRSKEASEKLVKLGYTNIVEFGGILDWKGEIVTD